MFLIFLSFFIYKIATKSIEQLSYKNLILIIKETKQKKREEKNLLTTIWEIILEKATV